MREQNQKFIYLHVFVVPLELWLDKYRFAYNNAVLESPSIGFIRIPPESPLHDVRSYIRDQLHNDVVPSNFIFLRSVGRCLAVVNDNQEMTMKGNEFVPPATYSPELFLLPCKHEDIFIAGKNTKQNIFYYDGNDSTEISPSGSGDDVPFTFLPNNNRTQLQENIINNNTLQMSGVPDMSEETPVENVGIFCKSIDFSKKDNPVQNQQHQQINQGLYIAKKITTSNDVPRSFSSIATTRSSTVDDSVDRIKIKSDVKRHSLSDISIDQSATSHPVYKQLIKPEISVIPATPIVNFPLPSAHVIVSKSISHSNPSGSQHSVNNRRHEKVNSTPKGKPSDDEPEKQEQDKTGEIESKVLGTEKLKKSLEEENLVTEIQEGLITEVERISKDTQRQEAEGNDGLEDRRSALEDRRSALEARVRARFEKENKRLVEEHGSHDQMSKEKQKQLIQQMEEIRRKNKLWKENQTTATSVGENEEILTKLKQIGNARKKKGDQRTLRELKNEEQERKKAEMQEQKKLKIEQLRRALEQAKAEKHTLQRSREANGKRARTLQTEVNNRNIHSLNQWKKKYEEEKKQTDVLEENLNKLKHQIDIQHRKLVTHSSPIKHANRREQHAKGAPSERSNQKNQVLRLQSEIEHLKTFTELTTKRLAAESKMKSFATQELKEFRTKALEGKINAARVKKTLSP